MKDVKIDISFNEKFDWTNEGKIYETISSKIDNEKKLMELFDLYEPTEIFLMLPADEPSSFVINIALISKTIDFFLFLMIL